ncbi:putative RNA polymerase sigma-70 factor [Vibrio nigripulchritudo SFn27]|uniref:Putative RNA polymerase sigma-70 factor n=1 Tax=Vibrio nigripulchritudo TaxID=28173 RepID=U4K3D8_9VIBR|nr:sigma-70 family RNA polymerase sigma factor [Vibrio nigripulchritudo]CCN83763.1 putative RNA polymerase sigma-70 factor [Vibrio nigripulchritudo BLFn1]CCN87229.1 putative RNA polymerase sigma-70 factor [Vibrio nigripulchritudo SFn27]CCN94587.1 putative RNA polymerase sigma-70 factor [Vibrio nigripulchritudo ENn2]CCO40849.1 putative RNA polymerase sigma-70 factor [Vibrio nigripulchritudo SFn135]CCO54928.1 putative RNA polymerase sigma-70 factor [Vibrio nigripulchritudo Wn13]
MTDNDLTSYSDIDLIERVLEKDSQAAEVLVRRYNQLLFRIARGFTQSNGDAMDIVQEAHLRALQNLSSFRGPTGYSSWLTVITRNVALNRLRTDQRLEFFGDDEPVSSCPTFSVSEPVMNQNILQLLEKEIDQLPVMYRTVFVMRSVQGMTSLETADSLGLDVNVIKTRYRRARLQLQSQLIAHMERESMSLYEFAGERCNTVTRNVLSEWQKCRPKTLN